MVGVTVGAKHREGLIGEAVHTGLEGAEAAAGIYKHGSLAALNKIH